ncbi:MAG: methionine synthase [Candidatus Fimivivens sp.]
MRLRLSRPLAIDRGEALRYLGSREDPSLSDDLTAAVDKILTLAMPAAAAIVYPLDWQQDAPVCGGLTLPGAAISRHLKGCRHCMLLAVTLGFAVDRHISAAGQATPYQALLLDACATTAIEDLADHATERARELLLTEPHTTTFRFSPGYGDLPLALQPKLLELLDARRLLGLTVGSSLLLSPIKSVTAVIGISNVGATGASTGLSVKTSNCAACDMAECCPYSKSKTKG